jgi:hypothetical protein
VRFEDKVNVVRSKSNQMPSQMIIIEARSIVTENLQSETLQERLRENKGVNTAGKRNCSDCRYQSWRITALKFLPAALQIEQVTCIV